MYPMFNKEKNGEDHEEANLLWLTVTETFREKNHNWSLLWMIIRILADQAEKEMNAKKRQNVQKLESLKNCK